jgi:hypothetical protein
MTSVPSWRTTLEDTIRNNIPAQKESLFYVSLATIKSFGRPANRTIFFRGFLTESDEDNSKEERDEKTDETLQYEPFKSSQTSPTTSETSFSEELERQFASLNTTLSGENVPLCQCATDDAANFEERLQNTVLFVTDARSGSVEDLIHGSRFGEVSWFFPHTKEQFRLSGTLHLVVSPDHPLSTEKKVPLPFSDVRPIVGETCESHPSPTDFDWEEKRLDIWRHVSSVRRASFSWPDPGLPKKEENREFIPSLYPVDDGNLNTLTSPGSPPLTADVRKLCRISTPDIEKNVKSLGTVDATSLFRPIVSDQMKKKMCEVHQAALRNFCLLLLEVDGVDYSKMDEIPYKRIKYRRNVTTGFSRKREGVMEADEKSHLASLAHWIINTVNP